MTNPEYVDLHLYLDKLGISRCDKLIMSNWFNELINELELKFNKPMKITKRGKGANTYIHKILLNSLLLKTNTTFLLNLLDNRSFTSILFNTDPMNDSSPIDKECIMSIYILQRENTNIYKIGISKNVNNRVDALKTAIIENILILYHRPVNYAYKVEKYIHKLYKNKQLSGEWFELTIDDVNNIKDIMNNIETIPITYTTNKITRPNISFERTRTCEQCHTQFTIYPSDISRGKGMFCCKSCAAVRQKYKKFEKICKCCGSPFKTTIETKTYCCEECRVELEKHPELHQL